MSYFFVLLMFAVTAGSAASLIGYDVLGQEQIPQNAALIRNGYAPQNPAVNAFENKTKFGTSIYFEYASPANPLSDATISLNSFNVPSISMVFPLGGFGVLGVGLNQKFFANSRLELKDSAYNADVSLNSRLGLYELNPAYSIRLPLALNDFSVGIAYRIFFGNSNQNLNRGAGKSWAEPADDSWMSRNVSVIEKRTGEFESDGSWWRPFGASLHLHRKSVDYYLSYFPSVPMKKEVSVNTQFSDTDTLQTKKSTENFTLAKRLASGVHFRFAQSHNISLGYEEQDWKDDLMDANGEFAQTQTERTFFGEYKITGTGLYYSPFFKKNNFGLSGWYSEKYIKDVEEYGASLFSDIYLGRRGTIVSLALLGGWRDGGSKYWEEPFFGFKLNLTGVGNWGQSSRRR